MGREYGAAEVRRFVKEKLGFKSAGRLFDSAFARGRRRSKHGRRDLDPRGLKLSELSGRCRPGSFSFGDNDSVPGW